jgi:AmmeMemoRadiSam system protein A
MDISETQKETLLKLARITIAEKLGIDYPVSINDLDFSDQLYSEKSGGFVTLHKNGALRGCIGYVVGIKTVKETVADMAISAGFRDPRFPPLTKDEFDDIDIEISVLSPITEVKSVDEIEVGKHGLIMSNDFNSGLLLPQVPVEQGWDKETFLEHTCMKAGLPPDSWKKSSTTIEKFSATVFGERS